MFPIWNFKLLPLNSPLIKNEVVRIQWLAYCELENFGFILLIPHTLFYGDYMGASYINLYIFN